MDADGKLVAELAKSDMTKFSKLGLRPVEMLTFKAAMVKRTFTECCTSLRSSSRRLSIRFLSAFMPARHSGGARDVHDAESPD
jgi:hypothetical protein